MNEHLAWRTRALVSLNILLAPRGGMNEGRGAERGREEERRERGREGRWRDDEPLHFKIGETKPREEEGLPEVTQQDSSQAAKNQSP